MVIADTKDAIVLLSTCIMYAVIYGILYLGLFKNKTSKLISSFGILIVSLTLFIPFNDVFDEVVPIIASITSIINLLMQFIISKFQK